MLVSVTPGSVVGCCLSLEVATCDCPCCARTHESSSIRCEEAACRYLLNPLHTTTPTPCITGPLPEHRAHKAKGQVRLAQLC